MVILIKALQVVLALSILIFIHELGHFMWAKIFGIRVEKFYLFFDAGGKALLRFRKGETEFGIGWVPLGGYCKIAGMVDESMDMEQMKRDPQPWEFRTHPAWQRFLVMAGGVLNNFIFAVLVYIGIMAGWGKSYFSNDGARIYVNDLAYEMGFRNGDRILRFDDYEPEDFFMLQADLARRDVHNAIILRGDDTLSLYIDHSLLPEVINSPLMFDMAIPFVVDSLVAGGANASCGLQRGDAVIAFDGESVEFVQDSRELLYGHRGGQVEATVLRGADTLCMNVQVDTAGHIGVLLQMPRPEVKEYTLLEAVPAGVELTGRTIGGYLQDLKLLATPSTGAYKSVGSFIAMGQVFPSSWNWYQFLQILALLSIMLAVMNMLPIPALDGGHMVFTIYEMITGRKPSDKFLAVMQIMGMVILLALMMLAFGNDIGRLLK